MSEDENNGHESKGPVRHYFVKVDRSKPPPAAPTDGSLAPLGEPPQVDYVRLGSPSDIAQFKPNTPLEKHAVEALLNAESFGELEHEIGGAGTFGFTTGDHTDMVVGNSFARVAGEAYRIYGEKHEIIDEANVISGAADGLFGGFGLEYKVAHAAEFSATAAAKMEFTSGFEYASKLAASIESTTGIGLGLSLGGEVEVAHAVKAEFNATGEYSSPSSGLSHSEKPVFFGEDSITLGVDDDPLHGTLKKLLKGLAVGLQVTDLAYTANGVATVARLDDFKQNPDEVQGHVDAAQIISLAQTALALTAGVVCAIAGRIQKQKADALAGNIGGKPYFRIEKPGAPAPNKITLDTGGGAMIELEGDTVTIRATTINIETNVVGSYGPINLRAGTNLDMFGADSILMSTQQVATVQAMQGIDLNAGTADITSTGAKWTHTGQFEAGQTTLGATTATSLNVTGAPVPGVPTSVVVQSQVQTLQNRINATATTALLGLGTALYSLLG